MANHCLRELNFCHQTPNLEYSGVHAFSSSIHCLWLLRNTYVNTQSNSFEISGVVLFTKFLMIMVS